MLTLMTVREGNRIVCYTLHVIENGYGREVARTCTYPEALGAAQTWTKYLTDGGTLRNWCEAGR